MTVVEAIAPYRIVICVGTGGVGKTTVAAALALAAAQQGRRALVLTIDPARALARALGLSDLAAETRIPGEPPLFGAMLDQKRAWDAYIHHHAPSPLVAEQILANSFYQRLSTSFAGSTEYMAIDEMCRYAESGRFDLIVLDTPPSAHALDFVTAPERIDRLLDHGVTRLAARQAWRSAGVAARFLVARVERATGATALRDITAFFVALDALVDATLARTRRARALLHSSDAAFVLVTAPRQLVLAETKALAAKLAALPMPVAAVIANRVHDAPVVPAPELADLGDDACGRWMRGVADDVLAEAAAERETLATFGALLPVHVPLHTVREADHDLHALADLEHVAAALR